MHIKRILWGLLILLFSLAALKTTPSGPQLNVLAPPFEAQLHNQETFRLKEQLGKVIVLDFWATWCPPCRQSLPALSKIADIYKNDSTVWVGTVNKERLSDTSLRKWMTRMKLDFPVIRDRSGMISRSYNVKALPTLIIINTEGKVQEVQVGLPSTHIPTLVKHIKGLIEAAQ